MAGIYWNETEGLISLSSDGSTWITIADKNLGATTVYNDGDTLSEANGGKFYQWGNNYGFPFTGPEYTSRRQVSVSGEYGPSNYYDSNVFVYNITSWSYGGNSDLWGGATNTLVARKGPCDTDYHVPSNSELVSLTNVMKALGIIDNSGNVNNSLIKQYLKMPFPGNITYSSATHENQGNIIYLWSSDIHSDDYTQAYVLYFYNNKAYNSFYYNASGFSVRPFANTPVIPDYNDTWETLYGDDLPDRPEPPEPPKPKLKWIVKGVNYYYFGEKPTHASGITLNKSSITLSTAGQTEQLTATVTPEDAVNKKVLWSSSNTSIATVSSTGLVTCVEPGECTITATAVDGGASSNCSVRESALITTPGIYYNTNLGILSLSADGENWITIADKNLGATTVYEYGDTLSEANCGGYFQWGNNYMFPFSGGVTTSSTEVNAQNYGPGNYYSSSTFIINTTSWDSSNNANLWGDITNTNEARKGPCDSGWHVPSKDEFISLRTILQTFGLTVDLVEQYLKLPKSGRRDYRNGAVSYDGDYGVYWSTFITNLNVTVLQLEPSQWKLQGTSGVIGAPIRPFKNEAIQPNEDWDVIYTPPIPLHFTANTAGSTVWIEKNGSPTNVNLEYSYDNISWSDYTIGNTITLSDIGSKVYFRNKSITTTEFSSDSSNRYNIEMTGSINAGGDVTSLINKNCTDTLSGAYCFYGLFQHGSSILKTAPELPATTLTLGCYKAMFSQCTGLTVVPELPATTLQQYCYDSMFIYCSNLEALPELPATNLPNYCYTNMFNGCSKIKLSTTQTGEYQNSYRIPITGTGTTGSNVSSNMFYNTGGTFKGTPTINTTYYTSNEVV